MRTCALVLATTIAAAGCGSGTSGVHWDDPAGDVKPFSNAPDRPRLDIVRVEAEGREGALRLRVKMKDDLGKFLGYTDAGGNKYGSVVAGFFIDTDNNPDTGGHPMFHENSKRPLRGYEYQVSLQAGYRYKQGQATGTGTGDIVIDTAKYSDVEPIVSFFLNRLKQGSSAYDFEATRKLPANARELAQKATAIRGEWVETAVPYEWLGLKAGETIRLCFREPAATSFKGEDMSEDRTLKLGR